MHLPRGLRAPLVEALRSRPAVILEGARGVGKTTLARQLLDQGVLAGAYRTMADETTRSLAAASPKAFVEELPFGSVVDEAQLVPEVQLPFKQLIDDDPRPGRVLLTGSSRLAKDQLGGTPPLAGRSTSMVLEPFTRSERAGTPCSVLDNLLAGSPQDLPFAPQNAAEILAARSVGGFPLLDQRRDMLSFIDDAVPTQVLGRRSREAFLSAGRLLARRTAQPIVVSDVGDEVGVDKRTMADYLDLWQSLMLVRLLPNWRPNDSRRARRRVHVVDAGLAMAWGDLHPDRHRGALLETLVANELVAQRWGSTSPLRFFHYRQGEDEVDLVIENLDDGALIGIEVKAAAEVAPRDFRQLRRFRERTKGRMTHGYVFHAGDGVHGAGDGLWAVPIPLLWGATGNGAPIEAGASPLEVAANLLHETLMSRGNPSLLASRRTSVAAVVDEAATAIVEQLEPVAVSAGIAVRRSNLTPTAFGGLAVDHLSHVSLVFVGDSTSHEVAVLLAAVPTPGDRVTWQVRLGQRGPDEAEFDVLADDGNQCQAADFAALDLTSAVSTLMPTLADALARL